MLLIPLKHTLVSQLLFPIAFPKLVIKVPLTFYLLADDQTRLREPPVIVFVVLNRNVVFIHGYVLLHGYVAKESQYFFGRGSLNEVYKKAASSKKCLSPVYTISDSNKSDMSS